MAALHLVLFLFLLAGPMADCAWMPYTKTGAYIYYSAWFSEEAPGTSGVQSWPIVGIRLQGRYSDNMQLIMARQPAAAGGSILLQTGFTTWFSEEQYPQSCPGASIVSEVQCQSSYCDKLRLGCATITLSSKYSINTADTRIVPAFSEEQGMAYCPDGYVLKGLGCSGSYCDNIIMTCVKMTYTL